MAKKGRLIVLDGIDKSGKATQSKLLAKHLKKEGYLVRTIDFPHYGKNLLGNLIGEALEGKHGDFLSLDPKIASVLYAADRYESKKQIEKWLKEGAVVISDRYVSANQIHQGGKIKNLKERKKFMEWLSKLEYEVFGIPHPDLILYLHTPPYVSLKLLGEKKDVVEKDKTYFANSYKSAEGLMQGNSKWKKIECVEKGWMRSRESIHEDIWNRVRSIL